MKTNKTIQEITKDLVAYFGNGNVEGYNDRQQKIMAEYQRDWEDLPCDAEGANADQEKEQADFLEKVANEILGADVLINRIFKNVNPNNKLDLSTMQFVEFDDRNELGQSVSDFFHQLAGEEGEVSITSNVIGYIYDNENDDKSDTHLQVGQDSIGCIEEHYIDSGSVDYYYTALIF